MKLQTTLLAVLILIIGIFAYTNFGLANKNISARDMSNIQQAVVRQSLVAQNVDPQKGVLGTCDANPIPLVASEQPPADGSYISTGFGCYTGEDPDHIDTPGCEAYCENPPGECDGLNKHDCMYKLKWFAANMDQYGCGTKLKVTNPANGKAAVVIVYDKGPNCSEVLKFGGLILDLSYPATSYLGVGNYEKVHAEIVDSSTKLGPTDGSSGTSPPSGSTNGPVINIAPLSLVVRPKPETKDIYIINKATAQAAGGGGSTPPGGGLPLPSQDVQEVKKKLCTDFHVCPTVSPQAPDQDWTLAQITALWNVVQKIYESPTYQPYAIGNYTLEITRADCYPQMDDNGNVFKECDSTQGYYAGQVYPGWGTESNARLIVITNNAPKEEPIGYLEWLFAHEIGHSASGGLPNGGLADSLGGNDAYRAVESCETVVSGYGETNWNENNSEILSAYMTNAEEAKDGYYSPTDKHNLKTDFPCVYNAAKDNFFGGVEY